MSQVLGIDIGSYTIKFAFLSIEKSDVILKNVISIPIPLRSQPDEEKLAKIQALRQVLENTDLANLKDNIYAGLSSQYTVLQNFEFLKVSTRNLPKIVENEFDELGLFPLDEYLIELNILGKESKRTKVMGMLIKKSAARDLVEILTAVNLNCRIIDIECLAFQNLIPYTPQLERGEEKNTNLIVNIGHSKTSVVIIENNQVISERSFNLAGYYITSKIQTECALSYENAQELKHNISGKIDYHSEHAEKAKSILIECCGEIGKELERIILGFTRSNQVKGINSVLLTGGTSKVNGLAQMLENTLGVRTLNINLSNPNFRNTCQDNFVFESYAQAIALGLRGTAAKTNSNLNIRHGDLALISDYENIIDSFFSYSKIIAIILISFLGTYALRYFLYNNKINQIKNLFTAEIVSYFGTEPVPLRVISARANWDFEQYNAKALEMINQTYSQRVNLLDDIDSEKTVMPLIILNAISAAIPKSIYFEVSDYNYHDPTLSIQADTDSKESMNEIIKLISSIKRLTNVEKKSEMPKAGTNGNLISFSLVATVKSKEGS